MISMQTKAKHFTKTTLNQNHFASAEPMRMQRAKMRGYRVAFVYVHGKLPFHINLQRG